MILFDFQCGACHHTFEKLVKSDDRTATCPQCGGLASKTFSQVNFKLDPVSGDFPTATDRWIKDHVNGAKKNSHD